MSVKTKLRNAYVAARSKYYKHILRKPRVIISQSNLSSYSSLKVSKERKALSAFK